MINIIPKLPSADDEYTPEQRRIIDHDIVARGLDDIKKGRVHGPFENAEEAIAYLKRFERKRKRTQAPKPVR